MSAENDTNISESSWRHFREIDSSYRCKDWFRNGFFGYELSYQGSTKDSLFSYNSYDRSHYISVSGNAPDVQVAYDSSGNLLYRQKMTMLNGDYGVEEILEKRDTFYHVINFYHQMYWDSKDHITEFFPYCKQVYLDDDSVVTRVLEYSFEKQDEWPVLTITQGDSAWTENTNDGGRSKYAAGVAFCGGAIGSFQVCEMNETTFSSKGMTNRRVEKRLKKYFDKNQAGFMGGVGMPPFYFIKNRTGGSFICNVNGGAKTQEAQNILSRSGAKAILYSNEEVRVFEGFFTKVFFELNCYVKVSR